MSTIWSDWLNQKSIAPDVLDGLRNKLPNEMFSVLGSIVVETKDDIKLLKENLKVAKKLLSSDDYDDLKEEISQVIEDNKFFGSKRGKYIAEINDWHQEFHKEFRNENKYYNVGIGGHSSKYVVLVTGFVENENVSQELMKYVVSKKPPYKLLWDVKIGKYS